MEVFVIETCLYCREMSVLHRLRAVSLFLQIYLEEWTRASVEPLPSRAFGHARGHCVSRAFCWTDQEKRETARSLLLHSRLYHKGRRDFLSSIFGTKRTVCIVEVHEKKSSTIHQLFS